MLQGAMSPSPGASSPNDERGREAMLDPIRAIDAVLFDIGTLGHPDPAGAARQSAGLTERSAPTCRPAGRPTSDAAARGTRGGGADDRGTREPGQQGAGRARADPRASVR